MFMIKVVDNNFDKSKWNLMADHPMQSWEWGDARKKMGIEILRLGEFGVENNVYQLTFHLIPHTKFKIGYLPRSVFPSKEVVEFLYEYGKKNNIIFFKIEPYQQCSNVAMKQSSNLVKSKHPLFPDWTQILDLTKSEEELLKNMKPKTRYNIRLAEKKGVITKEESNEKGFEIFSKLYFDTCKRQKYFGHTRKYHKIIWDYLKNNISHVLVAYYKRLPLAAYELFYFKDTFYYPYGGTSLQFRNLMGANLIMWEAVKLGKKLGAKKFDMWGSLPPDYNLNHPWGGFSKFKEGYGGEYIKMAGSLDLIVFLNTYKIYNLLYLLRSLFLRLQSRI